MNIKKPLYFNQPEVGKFIRELRLLTGLTQEKFAAKLGVTKQLSICNSQLTPDCPQSN